MTIPQNQIYYSPSDCDPEAFLALISGTEPATKLNHTDNIQKAIPVYDMGTLRTDLLDADRRRSLMTEWCRVLMHGAGILVLKNAYADTSAIDEATAVYGDLIAGEKLANAGGADHFAAAGSNDRVWNSLQKLCEKSPDVYLRYFSNPAIAAVCEAWLGPNYQMTAQVNLVHPGGQAQQAHRDYHLGFQTAETSAEYPAHVHHLSPVMTLQGAVAHCDMPLESGPTKLLPYSQTYGPGYLAWRMPEFRRIFEDHCVQLELEKGDALFFNPAVFHAAGSNSSGDIHRMANLLQVSSAFGRAMEQVDRVGMCNLLYPHALAAKRAGSLEPAELDAAIAATAEGYSFPTNLDRDPPVGGLAPETQADLFARALREDMDPGEFAKSLDALTARRQA